jgi:hypothetical protein
VFLSWARWTGIGVTGCLMIFVPVNSGLFKICDNWGRLSGDCISKNQKNKINK